MRDRIVQYPNRYTDQNGNILILTPAPGTVTELGTPLNKANLLNDTTQSMLGLPDNRATPSEAFKLLPIGIIAMWSGAIETIPEGWALCDGNNGTPDLRDRFIVGAGSTYPAGDTGGSATYAVSAHSHTYSGKTQTEEATGTGGSNITGIVRDGVKTKFRHTHKYSGTTETAGAATIDTIPPYYALAYIMRVAITG